VTLVFLRGDAELIAERMRQREHFMPVSLLETQLATLEPPSNAIIVNIAQPLETMLEQVIAQLGP
jgi:gluconokinase